MLHLRTAVSEAMTSGHSLPVRARGRLRPAALDGQPTNVVAYAVAGRGSIPST
jgi:hypothetical protein